MRRTWTITLALALVVAMSAAAMAAAPAPAVQTPLNPTKIPQFAQPLNKLDATGATQLPVALALGTNLNVNICEFQTQMLPPGTPVVPAPAVGQAPLTWAWGYQVDPSGGAALCKPNPGTSYLGPVAVALRGAPTQLTIVNKLPDANKSNVKAYATSTDQTLIWGDPMGLNSQFPLGGPRIKYIPELNECWLLAQTLIPPAVLPAACLNNYGFTGPQVLPIPPTAAAYPAPTPAAVHIHGGEVPAMLDGGPDAWWTKTGVYGHGFYTRHVFAKPVFVNSIQAALPALPFALSPLPPLPDALYPANNGIVYYDVAGGTYVTNVADVWTTATVPFPLNAVIFSRADAASFVNTLNNWVQNSPTGNTLIQVIGGAASFFNQLANTFTAVAAFTEGTLVFNEADSLFYQATGGQWVQKTAVDRASYVYPNAQEAAPVWFHDHMLGATRLNVYAGIAGGYYLIDPYDPVTNTGMKLATGLHALGLDTNGDGKFATLDAAGNVIWQGDEFIIPLIIQDRMFDTNGQLFFPNVGINPEHPFWVPEFVGDTICVNGRAWPFLDVQPRRYKFLFLNGSNARSYELYFPKGPTIYVVANDQGYLDYPVPIIPTAAVNNKLTMMPGERYEVIIDFKNFAGQKLILQNTARTPWVGGAPVNGQTTGKIMQFRVAAAPVAPAPPINDLSYDPALGGVIRPTNLMNRLTVANLVTPGVTPVPNLTIHKYRRLTLNEVIAKGGPLEILVNNTLYDGTQPKVGNPRTDFTMIPSRGNQTWYSELPHEGETELWEIVNLTADAHPMHPHLVAFQVLNRQPLDVKGYLAAYNAKYLAAGRPIDGAGPPFDYNTSQDPVLPPNNCLAAAPGRGIAMYLATVDAAGQPTAPCVLGGNPDPAGINPAGLNFLLGPAVPPAQQEMGWKDTVQALPNMVTRILVRFARPTDPIVDPVTGLDNSDSIGYDFNPNHGHGYVWHCHIVDHEDNEMMRPYSVYDGPYVNTYVMGINY